MHRSSAELKLIKPKSAISTAKTSCTEKRHAVESLANLDPQNHGNSGVVASLTPEENSNHSTGSVLPVPQAQINAARWKQIMLRSSADFRLLALNEAAPLWLEERKNKLKPRSCEMYEYHFRQLGKFFDATIKLQDIHIGHLIEYQQWRTKGGIGGRIAGASCVNHELSALSQILRRADLWKEIAAQYEPLPLPDWQPPKVMTEEQKEKFFGVASGNPLWQVAYWALQISANTTITGCELRQTQLQHIFLEGEHPNVHVPSKHAKNEFRARVIPLNPVAFRCVSNLLQRARRLGANKPTHYLFPYRVKRGTYDPERPASSSFIRTALRCIRHDSGILHMTNHRMRHQLITEMYEQGIEEQTIQAIAGHQSPRMTRHYSKIRLAAKAQALNMICSVKKPSQSADLGYTPQHERKKNTGNS